MRYLDLPHLSRDFVSMGVQLFVRGISDPFEYFQLFCTEYQVPTHIHQKGRKGTQDTEKNDECANQWKTTIENEKKYSFADN